MKIKITAELHNNAIHGNTQSAEIEIADDELEGLDVSEREEVISDLVKEHVLDNMVGWDWEAVDDA